MRLKHVPLRVIHTGQARLTVTNADTSQAAAPTKQPEAILPGKDSKVMYTPLPHTASAPVSALAVLCSTAVKMLNLTAVIL